MADQTVEEALQIFRSAELLSSSTEERILRSYEFFEEERGRITQKYPHQWVAVFENKIFSNENLRRLEDEIDKIPNSEYAYIEKIP